MVGTVRVGESKFVVGVDVQSTFCQGNIAIFRTRKNFIILGKRESVGDVSHSSWKSFNQRCFQSNCSANVFTAGDCIITSLRVPL